jgi:hypothetical protein
MSGSHIVPHNALNTSADESADCRLTELLVERVMHWKIAPDRYIKSGRSWLPKWRFTPLTRLDDAFQLLDRFASTYKLERTGEDTFAVEVHFGGRVSKASGESKARVITLAIAQALLLEADR